MSIGIRRTERTMRTTSYIKYGNMIIFSLISHTEIANSILSERQFREYTFLKIAQSPVIGMYAFYNFFLPNRINPLIGFRCIEA